MERVSCNGRTAGGERLTTVCMRTRLRHAVEPALERSVVGQDQVSLGAGLVNKVAEADDGRNLCQGLTDAQAWRGGENGIGLIEQQHLGRLRQRRLRKRAQAGEARLRRWRWLQRRCKAKYLPLIAARIHQRFQGIDGQRVEQAVGMGERRAADHGGGRAALRELMRETLDDGGAHSGLFLDRLRREVGQARRPSRDERTSA